MRKLLIILTFGLTILYSQKAEGETIRLDSIQAAIQTLQPRVRDKRAKRLAGYIIQHSTNSQIDPLLTTALIFRESSFSYSVEIGRKRGRPPQRCIGLMQIHPWGPAHKLGGFCNLANADCNIRTGTMWLEYLDTICGDTHWQWVASYGMSSCPSYYRARRNPATITARRLYCRIKKNCQKVWPRWRKRA